MKRGQAAMEFLMTYGWAILVVLVAIGALAYFGVLNPSRFLPSSCTIAPGVGCDQFKVTSNGETQLMLRNGMGDSLTAVNVTVAQCTDATHTALGWTDGDILGGAGTGLTFTGCTVGAVGSRFKSGITIGYTSSGGMTHIMTGLITTKVE